MQVSVSARHGQLQSADQRLIEAKAEKLRRLFDRVTAIEVTVDMEKLEAPEVEVRVSAEHIEDCVARASSTTVLAAMDTVIPKVEQQLRKAKQKLTQHRATGLKHLDLATETEIETETDHEPS